MDYQSQADNYYDDDSEPTGDDNGNNYKEDSNGDVYHYDEIIERFEELRQFNYYPFPSKYLLCYSSLSIALILWFVAYLLKCVALLNYISFLSG